jgi:hypothetical protein
MTNDLDFYTLSAIDSIFEYSVSFCGWDFGGFTRPGVTIEPSPV